MNKAKRFLIIILATLSLGLLAFGITTLVKLSATTAEPVSIVAYADETAGTAAATADEEKTEDNSTGMKAAAAGIAIGLAALGGAIAMGIAIAKSNEGIARQPEAEGKIRSTLMLGLVFIETAIIYALIVAILIVFVL